MKHIIDTDELEKLPRYDHETAGEWAGMVEKNDGDYVHIDDFRKLIANSPQADDVRKDAEREWTENDGNHESSKKLANRMGRIDVKFRSGFVAKDYSPNDFDFSQSGSDHDITAFRPHKFEKAVDKARE